MRAILVALALIAGCSATSSQTDAGPGADVTRCGTGAGGPTCVEGSVTGCAAGCVPSCAELGGAPACRGRDAFDPIVTCIVDGVDTMESPICVRE